MKINRVHEAGPGGERSVFQVRSIDVKFLEQIIGQEYHDLFWLMDVVFSSEKFKNDVIWPNGLIYVMRLIEEPSQVIEAFYDKDVISEDQIVEFFAGIGIETQKEIDKIVLEKVLEKDERNKVYQKYMEGKSEILPDGMTREQGEMGKRITDNIMRVIGEWGNTKNSSKKEDK